jgi:hypothetical protein
MRMNTPIENIESIILHKDLIYAPGRDQLTYGILKADRKGEAKVIRMIMREILNIRKFQEC